ALLMRPELVGKLNDLVVECGNSLHQQLADRFVLGGELISNGELERIWRFTIGGGVLWDSPVYEQVFHTVRALNWMRPARARVRVLLGDSAFDYRTVRGIAQRRYVAEARRKRDAPHA